MKNTKPEKKKSPKASTKTKSEAAKIDRKPDGTLIFKLTIPKEEVAKAYKEAVEEAVRETEIKGFRKGKAPENQVIEKVGKQKLYTETLKRLLPAAYADAIQTFKLIPITSPRIEPESLEEGQDWRLKVTVAEKPKIQLGDYKKAVSDALTSSKIWVPGKDGATAPTGAPTAKDGTQPQESTEERLAKVFDALLSSIAIQLPEFLVEEELNRHLARLVQQIEKLNLTIDQYVVSLGKSVKQLRQDYRQQAERTLKLEFILNEIAEEQKVNVNDEEIDAVIKAVGDEKLRKSLDTPTERLAIRTGLRKRKVIDSLLQL